MKWEVISLDSMPEHEGRTNVVTAAKWVVQSDVHGKDNTVMGHTEIAFDPSSPFVDYDNLTSQVVIDWIKASLGAEEVASYESAVASHDEVLEQRSKVNSGLPWNQGAE